MKLFDRFKAKEKSKRAVLIGLDGTPWTLVERFVKDGTMPNMARPGNSAAHGAISRKP